MNEAITNKDLANALGTLSAMKMFPANEIAHEAIVAQIKAMCPHREALRWLVTEMLARVPEWPGPSEMRGMLCTRYKPSDGIEADCGLPGYTASDGEALSERRAPKELPAGEAVLLIAGIKNDEDFVLDPALRDREIVRLERRQRELIGNPIRLARVKEQLEELRRQP